MGEYDKINNMAKKTGISKNSINELLKKWAAITIHNTSSDNNPIMSEYTQ